MYQTFFSLKEKPFKLVPNPAYLFLSKSHEEALAHLTYAISQGDGFVEITGEVGTGKTTLCRSFLENLDSSTEAAYIFNPIMDSIQLLRTINQEFGISAEADNTKDLIDELNAFLMHKKTEGKKVILLIDEAQNLSKNILEQVRLLSNLETTVSKLMQIILVGQPELGELLDSPELRQLAQRITLSCHILPLSLVETREYIDHRIHIASQKPGVSFSRAAYRVIYTYSGGIPRLINIAGDRALLTAYGLNQHVITGDIARSAIRELSGRRERRGYGLRSARSIVLAGCFGLGLVAVGLLLWRPGLLGWIPGLTSAEHARSGSSEPHTARDDVVVTAAVPSADPSTGKPGEPTDGRLSDKVDDRLRSSAPSEPPIKPEAVAQLADIEPIFPPSHVIPMDLPQFLPQTAASLDASANAGLSDQESTQPLVDAPVLQDLGEYLARNDLQASRSSALMAVLAMWRSGAEIKPYLQIVDDDRSFFRLAATQNGFSIHTIWDDLSLLQNLNLPALLEFFPPTKLTPAYLALTGIDDSGLTLTAGRPADRIRISAQELKKYWSGMAYIPWRNFFAYSGTIPVSSTADSVVTLKMLLRQIGFEDIEMNPDYDGATRDAVLKLQQKHGLPPDGIVGPLTKIVIYNENRSLNVPHISPEMP